MLFFVMLFDGILGFAVPIMITGSGVSNAMLGLVFGTSSIVGAAFDYYLSSRVKSVHYRRMFFGMFLTAGLYGLLLFGSNSLSLYVVALGFWGMYFDLMAFGSYDFVSRALPPEKHTTGFTVIDFSKAVGYVIAPLIAGFLIIDSVPPSVFIIAGIFLMTAFLIFLSFLSFTKTQDNTVEHRHRIRKPLKELVLWLKTAKKLHIPLIFMFLLYVTESFFWVIGPLVSEELATHHYLGGLILSAYFFPPLVIDWFVPRFTERFGKKRVAFTAFLGASILLTLFFVLEHVFAVVGLVLLMSTSLTFAYPAIRAAIADYISENADLEHEIEGVADFACNIGYAIGPIMAGVISGIFGNQESFAIWGIIATVVILFLLPHAREDIKIGKI